MKGRKDGDVVFFVFLRFFGKLIFSFFGLYYRLFRGYSGSWVLFLFCIKVFYLSFVMEGYVGC